MYLSSPILTIYPNHLNSANSVIPLLGLIPNPICSVLFLILSLLVSLFQSSLLFSLSVPFQWLAVDDYLVNTKAMIHTSKFVLYPASLVLLVTSFLFKKFWFNI